MDHGRPPRGPPLPRKSVPDRLTGPGTEREAAGGKHLKVMAGAAGREETDPAPPHATPAGCLSRGVWDPFGEAPQGAAPTPLEGHCLAHPCWQNPAPLCLPGPSGSCAPQALAIHAWTGPWRAAGRTGSPPSNPHPLRVLRRQQVQEVGAGDWQGTHVRLVQGTESKYNPSGAELIRRRTS